MSYEKKKILTTVKTEKSLFWGLDLGQARDFSALAIIECVRTVTSEFNLPGWGDGVRTTGDVEHLNCIHLQRWQLRTSYPAIVADVVRMINGLSPDRSPDHKPVLAIDATGVGAPVVDLFKREQINAKLVPVQIVAGANVSEENGMFRVPKRDLVSVVQVGLQNRKLKIAEGLDLAETLSRELQNFQVKIIDNANDTYGAWREGTHDDLVLAVALAVWKANQPIYRAAQAEETFAGREQLRIEFDSVINKYAKNLFDASVKLAAQSQDFTRNLSSLSAENLEQLRNGAIDPVSFSLMEKGDRKSTNQFEFGDVISTVEMFFARQKFRADQREQSAIFSKQRFEKQAEILAKQKEEKLIRERKLEAEGKRIIQLRIENKLPPLSPQDLDIAAANNLLAAERVSI